MKNITHRLEGRPFYSAIWQRLRDLRQMVFIAGPRQAGKTTFSKAIASDFVNSVYFNWDILENKRRLVEDPYFYENINRRDNSRPLVIFDEIHKHEGWKSYLKGAFDRDGEAYKFLVTGSGRLDLGRKGGDALTGRYVLFYLWPFTLAELVNRARPLPDFLNDPLKIELRDEKNIRQMWDTLDRTSGFPEPFLKGEETFYRIWARSYFDQIIRDDIRSLTRIRNVEQLEVLFSLLPGRVGSPCSIDTLARDVQVSFGSVKTWLKVFEQFFLTFRLSPWTAKVARSILKDRKIYLFNYAEVPDEAARFENRVAVELYRAVSNWNDLGLGRFSLHYIRNKDKEEVDFLIANGRKPCLLIETKLNDESISKSLYKFQSVLKVPLVLLTNKKGVFRLLSNDKQKILVVSADQWLANLP